MGFHLYGEVADARNVDLALVPVGEQVQFAGRAELIPDALKIESRTRVLFLPAEQLTVEVLAAFEVLHVQGYMVEVENLHAFCPIILFRILNTQTTAGFPHNPEASLGASFLTLLSELTHRIPRIPQHAPSVGKENGGQI